MSKVYTTTLKDAEDGSGDSILEFSQEFLDETGWVEGTVLNLKVEEGPSGNVLVITAVA